MTRQETWGKFTDLVVDGTSKETGCKEGDLKFPEGGGLQRQERDQERVTQSLEHIQALALGDDNLMPALIQAVEARATLGEICGALREAWGEYKPGTSF